MKGVFVDKVALKENTFVRTIHIYISIYTYNESFGLVGKPNQELRERINK